MTPAVSFALCARVSAFRSGPRPVGGESPRQHEAGAQAAQADGAADQGTSATRESGDGGRGTGVCHDATSHTHVSHVPCPVPLPFASCRRRDGMQSETYGVYSSCEKCLCYIAGTVNYGHTRFEHAVAAGTPPVGQVAENRAAHRCHLSPQTHARLRALPRRFIPWRVALLELRGGR